MPTERVIITIPARIHSEILDRIKAEYGRMVSVEGADYVLNMKAVDNLYSATLNLILHIHALVKERHGKACLVDVAEHLRAAIHTMKIDTVLPVYATMLDFEMEHDAG